MRIEAQPQPRERSLRELPKSPTYDTARHEVMHGLIDPHGVLGISAVAEGNTLGWTLMTNASDTARAAGIVHGRGSSHDEAMIRINALQNGHSPDMAVGTAVANARAILTGNEGLIDLMARELALRGTMSGSEFRDLLYRARNEISSKSESPIDWTALFGEQPEEDQEDVTITDNDPYILIPKDGKSELTIYTESGYLVHTYENGMLVKTDEYARTPETDELENYGEQENQNPEYTKIDTKYVSIFSPEKVTLPTKGTVFTFDQPKIEISLN